MDDLRKEAANEAMEAEINFGQAEFRVPGQATPTGTDVDGTEDSGGTEQVTESEKLASPGIREDLMKSRITGLSVPEQEGFASDSYLIDVTGCADGVDQAKMTALRMLTKDNGSKSLYIQTGTNCFLIGRIDAFLAYELLEKLMASLFGDGSKLYYQDEQGHGFKQVKTIQLSDVQLDL